MKLVNYGPGEISDRLSILSLKILFGTEAGKDCTHFETERTALLSQIRSRTLNGKWFQGYTELAAVNAALWHAEDEMRNRRSWSWDVDDQKMEKQSASILAPIVRLAFRIQQLNDRRAALVQQINMEAGENVGEEKF
jgi:hypothetical protein